MPEMGHYVIKGSYSFTTIRTTCCFGGTFCELGAGWGCVIEMEAYGLTELQEKINRLIQVNMYNWGVII